MKSFQGAEAIINISSKSTIKNRIKKNYRISIIDDRLRKQRTKKEIKLLEKADSLIPVPTIIKKSDFTIEMETIKGKKLSLFLDKLKNKNEIAKEIGKNIAILHDNSIIHGDLTTSNMIYSKNKVYFIDFGLGFESNKAEDKATDLHLIKQALEAKHFKFYNSLFQSVIEGYQISKNFKETLKRLETVEQRGRYKQSY